MQRSHKLIELCWKYLALKLVIAMSMNRKQELEARNIVWMLLQ